MASHRMSDDERPRRAVPAWVTTPPEALAAALEARPTPLASAPASETAGRDTSSPVPASAPAPAVVLPAPASAPAPGTAFPAPGSAPGRLDDEVVVPDYPPQQDLLPPAPTSPAVHTVPFDQRSVTASVAGSPLLGPAPVSPIDAVPFGSPDALAGPVLPVVGQPRFSVPGLEHVVVAGAVVEPSGPIGYRTPARFAHQQRAVVAPAPESPAEPSFDAVLAPPTAAAPTGSAAAPVPSGIAPIAAGDAAPATDASEPGALATTADVDAEPAVTKTAWWRTARRAGAPTERTARSRSARARAAAVDAVAVDTAADTVATSAAVPAEATVSPGAAPSLQARSARRPRTVATADGADDQPGRSLVGVTPGAVLGAVAGVMALGVAAWWFTAPATVHAVGLVLGVLAVLLSVTVLRNPLVTWQRPVALLGAVLGGVGALVLLWAVASAVLSSTAGVTLPDLTGTGVVPTLAP